MTQMVKRVIPPKEARVAKERKLKEFNQITKLSPFNMKEVIRIKMITPIPI